MKFGLTLLILCLSTALSQQSGCTTETGGAGSVTDLVSIDTGNGVLFFFSNMDISEKGATDCDGTLVLQASDGSGTSTTLCGTNGNLRMINSQTTSDSDSASTVVSMMTSSSQAVSMTFTAKQATDSYYSYHWTDPCTANQDVASCNNVPGCYYCGSGVNTGLCWSSTISASCDGNYNVALSRDTNHCPVAKLVTATKIDDNGYTNHVDDAPTADVKNTSSGSTPMYVIGIIIGCCGVALGALVTAHIMRKRMSKSGRPAVVVDEEVTLTAGQLEALD